MVTQLSQQNFERIFILNSLIHHLVFELCTWRFFLQKLFTAMVSNAFLFSICCIFVFPNYKLFIFIYQRISQILIEPLYIALSNMGNSKIIILISIKKINI